MIKNINDLATLFPSLINEWDYDKNNLKPDEVLSRSHKKVWWKCTKNHSWQAVISSRTGQNKGCPYCAGQKVLKGFNDLATLFPELIKEWDYDKNNLNPDELTSKSSKKVWWKCDKGHSWKAIIFNRTGHKSSCPYCARQKVLKGFNDLKTYCLNNDKEYLLEEWDYDKNDTIPDLIMPFSNKKVWWKCSKEHCWKAIINNRTDKNNNCPICSLQYQTSFGEQSIYYYLKDYNALNRYKYLGKEIDIYLPDKNIGIEFNGLYWHKDRIDKDKEKELFLTNNNIKMFYICESDKNKIQNNKIYFDYKHTFNNNLNWPIKKLFKLLNFNVDVNITRDKEDIYKQYKYIKGR